MSKKKASTMTLRDFHGGNIPSDLPLPSAPGMVVERKSHDRPGSGGWMGSSLHRGYSGDRVGFSRQGSANFARSYEEKISYLPNPANIGRNYDEDERKPVDGHDQRPRSSDFYEESVYEKRHAIHERLPDRSSLDNKGGYTPSKHGDLRAERHEQEGTGPASSGYRVDGFSRRPTAYPQDLSTQSYVPHEQASTYLSQHIPPHSSHHMQEPVQPWRQSSLGQQPVTPGTVMGSGTGVQNVWTARKDGEYSRSYPADYVMSDAGIFPPSGLRVAQASALEKVSSGRWNSRIIQPPSEFQAYGTEYGQSYGGSFEGGSMYSPHNAMRSPAEYDRAVYNDKAVYSDSLRGIDSLSLRDTRFIGEKGSFPDIRREHFVEGSEASQIEVNRYVEERRALNEMGQKGFTGSLKEPAKSSGSRDGALPESGYQRVNNSQFIVNDGAPYSETRSTVHTKSGWVQPEPSPQREYRDGTLVDANKVHASDLDKRGISGWDAALDREYGIPQRSYSLEVQKGRGPQYDGPYQVAGKEESGYFSSSNIKSRDDYPQEAVESVRSGRFPDRSRGPDVDLNHPGRFNSPGSTHASSHENHGATSNLPVEEVKGTPVERPKLKLLPRTKPFEVEETGQDVAQEVFEGIPPAGLSRSEGATGSGSGIPAPSVNAGGEPSVRTVDRPKLSLKPRSQPVDVAPADSGSVKERMSVFGGARPRELVLKERGVDESAIVGTDLTPISVPSPVSGGLRTPIGGNRTSSGGSGYINEKQEKPDERNKSADLHEGRMGRQDGGRLERLDSRGRREHNDLEKKDEHRSFEQRNHQEKRESDRPDVDKQESWRRPTEVLHSPLTVRGPSAGAGRPIQTAAELAQAFSRSTSFGSGVGVNFQGNTSQRSPMPRSPGPGFGMGAVTPGSRKSDLPFSRLTEALSPGTRDCHVSGVQGGYPRTSAF